MFIFNLQAIRNHPVRVPVIVFEVLFRSHSTCCALRPQLETFFLLKQCTMWSLFFIFRLFLAFSPFASVSKRANEQTRRTLRLHLYDFDVWRTWAQSQNLCCGSLRSWPFSSQQFFCFVGVLDYVLHSTYYCFCFLLAFKRLEKSIYYTVQLTYICMLYIKAFSTLQARKRSSNW